ncbi:MAG: hypothetical protein WBH47_17360 [Streptosporangiaceae bacterium]
MSGPWWLDPPAETSEVLTGAVGTVERGLGLAGEEAALRRHKPPAASVSRNSRAGGNQDTEAAAAVATAARAHGRGTGSREPGAGRPDRKRPGRGAEADRGPAAER